MVLDYELKSDYQRFLQEHNRQKRDSDGRPDRTADEVREWALAHRLPYEDEHVQFPDVRVEYEDRDGRREIEDLEIVTPHYRGAHAAAKGRSGKLPADHGSALGASLPSWSKSGENAQPASPDAQAPAAPNE